MGHSLPPPRPRFPDALLDAIRDKLPLLDLVQGAGVAMRKEGRNYFGLCPMHGETTPSFSIFDGGKSQRYWCFGCGASGDIFSFWMWRASCDFRAAVRELGWRAGVLDDPGRGAPPPPPPPRPKPPEKDDAAKRAEARAIWQAAVPGAGTLVETYLRYRGIPLPVPPSLRFAARLDYYHLIPERIDRETGEIHPGKVIRGAWPAMVACVQDVGGAFLGVHRTYLRPDGLGKAPVPTPKKGLGTWRGGFIRLNELRPTVDMGEGIEEVLSFQTLCQSVDQEVGCGWVALSKIGIAGRADPAQRPGPHPARPGHVLPVSASDPADRIILPAAVRRLRLLRDGDDGDQLGLTELMRRAAARFARAGLAIEEISGPPGQDWNKILCRSQKTETAS